MSIHLKRNSDQSSNASFLSWMNHEERISELEHKINRTAKKSDTTRAQQMLFLHHLDLLKPITDLDISQEKKAKLLSVMLNFSPENLEKDLSALNKKDSHLTTSKNYSLLVKTFNELGLEKLEKKCQDILDEILKREENKKNKK